MAGAEGKVTVWLLARNAAQAELNSFRQSIRNIGTEAKNLLSNQLTQALSLGALGFGLKKAFDAADELRRSQLSLAAAANTSGANLEALRGIAAGLAQSYSIDDDQANKLTESMTRLAGNTGKFNLVGQAAAAVLDLGAARGWGAAESMDAIENAYVGVYRQAQRLLGANVPDMMERWAKAHGKTAAQMTQAQQAQVLLNALVERGGKVQGEYARWLNTAAGAQEKARLAQKQAMESLGLSLEPARMLFAQTVTWVMNNVVSPFVGGVQSIGAWLRFAFDNSLQSAKWALGAFLEWLTSDAVLGVLASLSSLPVFGNLFRGLLGSASTIRTTGESWIREAKAEMDAIGVRYEAIELEIAKGMTPLGAAMAGGGKVVETPEGLNYGRILAELKKQWEWQDRVAAQRKKMEEERVRGLRSIVDGEMAAAEAALEWQDRTGGLQVDFSEIVAMLGGPVRVAIGNVGLAIRDIGRAMGNWLATVSMAAVQFMSDFGGAIEAGFKAMVDGSMSAGRAFKGAMLEAVASVARALGQLMIGKAAEAMGDYLLNPMKVNNLAAFAKYMAAAALFFALAGTAAGAANAGGGGGGGGGATYNRQEQLAGAQRGKLSFYFGNGIVNLRDPRQFEEFVEAIRQGRDMDIEVFKGRG